MPDGRFIVFEGIDGAGTTTQAKIAADRLRAGGAEVVETNEPTRGAVGRVIRQALQCRMPGREGQELEPELFALLFAADRLDHMSATVGPALARGEWVVSDRCYLSSLAYQSVGCDLDWLRAVNRHARRADVIFLLDLDPQVAFDRLAERTLFGPLEVFETVERMRAIRTNYVRIADRLRAEGERIVTIDGSQPVDAVANRVQQELAGLFRR